MYLPLSWIAAVLMLAVAPLAARAERAAVLDVSKAGWEERVTAEALQGLANRGGARVYLLYGDTGEERWLQVYAERNGVASEPVKDLPTLVARFRRAVKGLVVYDPEVDGSRYVAVTMAGTDGLLPVCPVVMKQLAALRIPVKEDLRGRFADSVAAYDWALSEVMPRCSRKLAHSVDGGKADGVLTGVCGPMSGFDWQVQQRGFVFNLGCQPTPMESYGAKVGGSPAQADMYRRILGALEKPAMIDGYGDPEDYWCNLLSHSGHYSFHAYHNWSFHSQVPTRAKTHVQKTPFTPANTRPETERFYVCFMTSEGDTMKGPLPFFYESWFDPARGQVPVNWGVNPQMGRLFPAMLDYFYATATPSDYFFAGCSGAGYLYPDSVPDLTAFLRLTGEACKTAGIGHIDLWGGANWGTLEQYAKIAKPLAITSFTGPARMQILSDGTPVAYHELGYWQTHELSGGPWGTLFRDDATRAKAVKHLVDRIESIARRNRPPFVILVYGDLHSYDRHASLYKEVADALDPRRFKPARLDEAMAGIRAWASSRVLVGAEGIGEAPDWAYLQGTTTTLPVTLTNGRAAASKVEVGLVAGAQSRQLVTTLAAHEIERLSVLAVPPTGIGADVARLTLDAPGGRQEWDVHVAAVPGGGKYASATLVGMWCADRLIHPIGKGAAVADALGGTAWSSPAPDGKPHYDCMSSGPYSTKAKGRYVAAFRIRLAPGTQQELVADTKVLTLDVAGGGFANTGRRSTEKLVRRADLGAPGEWRWVTLEAEWPGSPDLMELRAWWFGTAQVELDRIALFEVK